MQARGRYPFAFRQNLEGLQARISEKHIISYASIALELAGPGQKNLKAAGKLSAAGAGVTVAQNTDARAAYSVRTAQCAVVALCAPCSVRTLWR